MSGVFRGWCILANVEPEAIQVNSILGERRF